MPKCRHVYRPRSNHPSAGSCAYHTIGNSSALKWVVAAIVGYDVTNPRVFTGRSEKDELT